MTMALIPVEITGLKVAPALRARICERLTAALAPIALKPMAAQVTFFDDNGPKGGGIRCALTVRVPYRPALRAEHVAETPRLAFDGSFSGLTRALERYRERDRDSRRHPKKYFAAKQVTEESPAPARPSRARRA
jgi:ribosome-associated translation inhibitor RaiA